MSTRQAPADPVPVPISMKILKQVYREARAHYPAECCGWISGSRTSSETTKVRPCINAQTQGDHPTEAKRGADTAYVIGGADLLALNREIEGDSPAKVIYHSHNNGRAYFSKTDHEVASSPWGDGPLYPVQQLVIGIHSERVVEAALFAWCERSEAFIEVQRFAGCEI